jgi:hypothetical protein
MLCGIVGRRVNSGVMRFRGNEAMMGILHLREIAICVCILALSSSMMAQGQGITSTARKFDEFSDLRTDDEMARLDAFASELNKDPNLRGYIVGYSRSGVLPGHFLRRIYGYWDYLVNSRGINTDSVKVVEGGIREKATTELWLAPKDDTPPKPSPEMQVSPTSLIKFDSVLMGIGCEPEFTIDLYELDAGLKFYANVLREHPNSQAWIIVYPNRRERFRKAAGVARQTKSLLIRDFNIEASRIMTRVSNRRQACMKAELWIVPVGAVPSMATHNNSFNPTPR